MIKKNIYIYFFLFNKYLSVFFPKGDQKLIKTLVKFSKLVNFVSVSVNTTKNSLYNMYYYYYYYMLHYHCNCYHCFY